MILSSNKFVLEAYLRKDGVIAHVSSFINDIEDLISLADAAKKGNTGADSIAAAVNEAIIVVAIIACNKVVLDAYLEKDGVIAHVSKNIYAIIAINALSEQGNIGTESIAAVVSEAITVVSIHPSNKVVLKAYLGKDGVIAYVSSYMNDEEDKNSLAVVAKKAITGADSIAVAVDKAIVVVSILLYDFASIKFRR